MHLEEISLDTRNQPKSQLAALLAMAPFLLVPSGCAALIYQVTWVRLLGLSMGATSAAVSIVLAAFFLGMSIGSYLSEKISKNHYSGLLTFATMEFLIAVTGVLLLPILLNLDHVMALMSDAGTSLPLTFGISLTVLIIPTACMGSTYPLLASALVRYQSAMGSGLGGLYTTNTAGAILGALLSGFILVPIVGLDGAVYVAALFNICTAVFAVLLYKMLRQQDPFRSPDTLRTFDTPSPSATDDAQNTRIALVLFGTGFLAIASEVAWTKYLSIFVGATLYGFSAILAIFLTGIALGAWTIKKHLGPNLNHARTVAWALIALAAALLWARVGLAKLPDILVIINAYGEPEQAFKYLAVFITLFPATFIFGALFPITLSMYCAHVADLSKRVGRGYAINTLGSILGSLGAGFWLIPAFGTDTLLTIAILATLALSLLFFKELSRQPIRALSTIAFVLCGTWQFSHLDYTKLISANPYRFDTDAMEGKSPNFLFLEEGKAGVISLVTYDNKKARLQNNGIQESYLPLVEGLYPPFTEQLLAIMPYLLHPAPESAFVVGFGGGNTLQALADTPLKKVNVVELEPAVISAVTIANGGNIPVLNDTRVSLKLNDARNTLLVENYNYDLIVSQPSHPWLSGAGNLFTKDFFEIASGKLNKNGIFAQWVNLFNMDSTTLRSILKAYYEVFPYGFTFANTNSGDLLIFGSKDPITFDYNRIDQRMQAPAIKNALSRAQVHNPEDLLWYFSLSRKDALAAAGDITANSDTLIISETRLAGMAVDPKGEENPYQLLRTHGNFDVKAILKPNESAEILYLAGRYFYSHFSTTRTRQAIAQLKSIDDLAARRLETSWSHWRDSLRNSQDRTK